ncbi:hypothetical protein FFM54_02305 [Burkholderia pseudomallei]|nr:hypothetical protein FFM54_02305 [Burkholderia pseudomallei]
MAVPGKARARLQEAARRRAAPPVRAQRASGRALSGAPRQWARGGRWFADRSTRLWAVGCGLWAVGRGPWAVGRGPGSGKWEVGGRQSEVKNRRSPSQ